jgi:hypothetical protein
MVELTITPAYPRYRAACMVSNDKLSSRWGTLSYHRGILPAPPVCCVADGSACYSAPMGKISSDHLISAATLPSATTDTQ